MLAAVNFDRVSCLLAELITLLHHLLVQEHSGNRQVGLFFAACPSEVSAQTVFQCKMRWQDY